MSCSIDANVLLYAANRSAPENARAVSFLSARAASRDILYLPWLTVGAFLDVRDPLASEP